MSNPRIDARRHMELFDPDTFTDEIHVIGAGATGSWLVMQLAKLGVDKIHVYDFDVVESHNIPNQLFGIQDIGKPKVYALYEHVLEQTGLEITAHNEAFVNQHVSGYVFCMIDSMSGRKDIWHNAIKFKPLIKHYIEPRMGMDLARIYNMKPMDVSAHKSYTDTLYSDDDAEVSACGTSMSVITSSLVTSAWCVRQLLEVHAGREVDHEILIDLQNNNIFAQKFSMSYA